MKYQKDTTEEGNVLGARVMNGLIISLYVWVLVL